MQNSVSNVLSILDPLEKGHVRRSTWRRKLFSIPFHLLYDYENSELLRIVNLYM